MTEPADMTSNALNAARIMELGLLAAAAGVISLAIIYSRCSIKLSSRVPLIVFVFCIWAMLSSLWSTNPILSFARGATLTILLYIAVCLVIYVRHVAADSVRAMSIVITTALLASIALLLVSNLFIYGTLFQFTDVTSWSGRLGRLILAQSRPLETGELLSLAIVVTTLTVVRMGPRVALLCLLSWMLYLTDARNLIAFTPIALAFAWFQRGSTQLRFIMGAAATCGLFLLVTLAVSGDLSQILPSDIATLNGRTPLWAKSAGIVAENPLLGVGYYASRFYLMDSHFFAGHAHNAYVETALGIGLVGLALLLAIFFIAVKLSVSSGNAVLTAIVVLCGLGSLFNPLILASNPHTFILLVMVLVVAEQSARSIPDYESSRSDFVDHLAHQGRFG